jgi:hypothetical protein
MERVRVRQGEGASREGRENYKEFFNWLYG